jgi:hypothetical protein
MIGLSAWLFCYDLEFFEVHSLPARPAVTEEQNDLSVKKEDFPIVCFGDSFLQPPEHSQSMFLP